MLQVQGILGVSAQKDWACSQGLLKCCPSLWLPQSPWLYPKTKGEDKEHFWVYTESWIWRKGVHSSQCRNESGVRVGGQHRQATYCQGLHNQRGPVGSYTVKSLGPIPIPSQKFALSKTTIASDILNYKSENVISNLKYFSGSPLLVR